MTDKPQATPPNSTALERAKAPNGPLLSAFRRGDRPAMLAALFGADELAGLTPAARGAAESLADLAIEVRRQSVATLGSHEAFVRHTANGSLYQVIRPVKLSMADKTLYQITKKRPFWKSNGEAVRGRVPEDRKREVDWKDVGVDGENVAQVTMPGYNRMNGVAGCNVGQPPSVIVDGEPRTNPFVERATTRAGRLGDIIRVVVAITVVGPAPATGNPVVLTYTLDYDPAKDLQHILAGIAENFPNDCYLVDEDDYEAKPHWKFTPMFAGVGYYYNLRLEAVVDAYATFTNLLQNAVKKAQTVARRNAMRAHPALAVPTVVMDAKGEAVIPVVGWAGDDRAMASWMRIGEALSRGQELPVAREMERIVVETEQYRPDVHQEDADGAGAPPRDEEEERIAAEVLERNRLIDQIDDGIAQLSPDAIGALKYDASTQTVEQLRDVLGRMNAALDRPS